MTNTTYLLWRPLSDQLDPYCQEGTLAQQILELPNVASQCNTRSMSDLYCLFMLLRLGAPFAILNFVAALLLPWVTLIGEDVAPELRGSWRTGEAGERR
jgi:hypothetical protein